MRYRFLTVGLTILLLSALPSGGVRADLSPVARDFQEAGRSLCVTLKLKCKPAKKPRKAAAAKKITKVAPVATDKTVKNTKRPPETIENTDSVKTDRLIVPIPRGKPVEIKAALPEKAPPLKKVAIIVPPPKSTTTTVQRKPLPVVPDNDCLASLRAGGAEFEALATPVGNGSCHVDMPVRLNLVHTGSGKIVLPDSPILSCRFARQFSLWLADTGAALVSTHLNVQLGKVSTGPGYECRGRNGDASAKLSEHAFGNAVDITTITTEDGRRIQISDAANPASGSFQVLRGLRTTACGYFSTVLGPGSNSAHASHFHLDMGMHGKSQNYRICE